MMTPSSELFSAISKTKLSSALPSQKDAPPSVTLQFPRRISSFKPEENRVPEAFCVLWHWEEPPSRGNLCVLKQDQDNYRFINFSSLLFSFSEKVPTKKTLSVETITPS